MAELVLHQLNVIGRIVITCAKHQTRVLLPVPVFRVSIRQILNVVITLVHRPSIHVLELYLARYYCRRGNKYDKLKRVF